MAEIMCCNDSPSVADAPNEGADLVDLSLDLLALLRRTGNRAFASVGLTYGQAMILMFVGQGCTRPKDLAETLGVVFPALSALLTNLVEAGLLLRATDPADGRRVELRVTPAGAKMCLQIRQAWREADPPYVVKLSEMPDTAATGLAWLPDSPKPH